MKFLFNRLSRTSLLIGLLSSIPANVLAVTPSPQVMAQMQQMSISEQKALAKKYGIELPQGMSGGGQPQADPGVLGERGEPIQVFDRVPQSFSGSQTLWNQQFRPDLRGIEDDEDELKRYGLNIFDREISTFSPVDDMPVPENYALGPGDSVNVLLYGKEQEELLLMVTRDGKLQFPRLGSVSVAGMTFADLKGVIEDRVKRQFVGTSAVVSIGKLRSINVFLAGEVVAPGSYSVSGLSTVTQVLYAAGGVSDLGSMRNIQVIRQGQVVVTFDMYDLLLRGDTTKDVRLSSGDTVFVPVMNSLVTADGEVRRPALYETLAGDSVKTVLQMAGGVSARGYSRSASISRYASSTASRSRVQLNLEDEADLSTPVFDGDFLEVGRVKDDIRKQVVIRGAVARPGGYAWREDLRISDILSNIDDDLLNETDLNTGLVVRRSGLGLEVEVLGLNLLEAINQRGSDSDILLQAQDEVLVFSLPYFNDSYKAMRDDLDSIADGPIISDQQISRGDSALAGYDERFVLADAQGNPEVEEDKKEDRQDLVEEVVFRLQAQAKTPAETNVVTVAGDVRLPGTYPLLQSGEVAELIQLAGGFEASAFLDKAEVTRLTFEASGSAKLNTIAIPLAEILGGGSKFKLEPRDQIQIRRIPNWSYGDFVEVSGAVVSPGEYPIAPGEMLSSVLRRANGLNQVAFAEGAILVKAAVKKREQEQIRSLVASIQKNEISRGLTRENANDGTVTQGGGASSEELLEILLADDVGGRVVIDLPAIVAGGAKADISLQAGDSLFVPEFSNTVSVIGEVREPGTFRFIEDRAVNDYVEYAAGITSRGMAREIYVVRANGGVERLRSGKSLFKFDTSKAQSVRPGDTIVVPLNEDYQPALTKYREVSTVIFNSLASLFPLFRL